MRMLFAVMTALMLLLAIGGFAGGSFHGTHYNFNQVVAGDSGGGD